MGEFHEAVSTLIEAFSSGIAIIKAQRGKRKHSRVQIDADRQDAESALSRTLKRSRHDVKHAYERDARELGDGFKNGDNEARSRLATILLRLNAGFFTLLNRFARGKTSPADYEALINLSSSSRNETMRTFEQLSYRVSQSNLSYIPSSAERSHDHTRRRKRKTSKKESSSKSRSTASLAVPSSRSASSEGLVRTKHRRMSSLDVNVDKSPRKHHTSKGHSKSTTHLHSEVPRSTDNLVALKQYSKSTTQLHSRPSRQHLEHPMPMPLPIPAYTSPTPVLPVSSKMPNRESGMSFASDSTKLGEIPVRRWMRPTMFENIDEDGEVQYPVTTFYPIEPYVEPVKRSIFRRMFRMP